MNKLKLFRQQYASGLKKYINAESKLHGTRKIVSSSFKWGIKGFLRRETKTQK